MFCASSNVRFWLEADLFDDSAERLLLATIGHSATYSGTTHPRMPFDLGHDTAVLVPAARLVAEAGMETTNMVERQER